ncbi:MAG: ABC transporter ATP-binding protein [Puniceicoccales bacterium]
MLKLSRVGKSYVVGDHSLSVLREVSLSVAGGETCAIIGPSGSGKTTLLGLCAGLDDPTEGEVELVGERLRDLSQDDRADLRSRSVGFVFQNFQLIPTLTALENVLVPLELRGESDGRPMAMELLERVGLSHRVDHYPTQLSGGEQQRVALARAFIHRPRILFADEPTGNLDEETSRPIVEMLFELNREQNTSLVLVTHDPQLAALAGRVIQMRGGSVVRDGQPE